MPTKKQRQNAARRVAAESAPIHHGPVPAFLKQPQRDNVRPPALKLASVRVSHHALARFHERVPASAAGMSVRQLEALLSDLTPRRTPPRWLELTRENQWAPWWLTTRLDDKLLAFPVESDGTEGAWVVTTCMAVPHRARNRRRAEQTPLARGARAGADWTPPQARGAEK